MRCESKRSYARREAAAGVNPGQVSRLAQPAALDDLLLYRLSRLLAVGGSPVIRLCEGRFGITRREWRVRALLDRVLDTLQQRADQMVASADLPKADRRRGGRTRRAMG